MRLGGRISAAIEILDDIERRHRPAGEALKDWGLSHRFAGSGDRAAIGNIVYDALRRRRSAGWRASAARSMSPAPARARPQTTADFTTLAISIRRMARSPGR